MQPTASHSTICRRRVCHPPFGCDLRFNTSINTLSRFFAASVALAIAATALTSSYGADLTIREREAGNVTILDLNGKITDDGGTAALHNAIRGMLNEGKLNILLNLKGVSYVDEGALAEIVASHTATEAVGGQLKLLNLSERAFGDALMITKFLTVFQVYDNEKEAVVSFAR